MNYKVLGTDRKEYGPAGDELVRQWIAEHRLTPMCLAQQEGAIEWKPLNAFPEFQAALASVAPPPSSAPAPGAPGAYPQTNNMAVLSLVMGLLAVTVCSCCHGIPFSLLGVVFGVIALSQLSGHPAERGRGMAIAGLVLSTIATVWAFALAALWAMLAGLSHQPHLFRL